MKFKLKPYRHRKSEIIDAYRQKGISSISYYCAVASFPIIAAISFINEEYPSKELEDKLKDLKEFYDIKEIIEEDK